MAGVFKLNIVETVEELKRLLGQQKTVFGKERVQALYLLKLNKVKTIQELAQNLGRDRTTVQRWLRRYQTGGISQLLLSQQSWGRKSDLPQWAQQVLQKQLHEPEGFHSYGEIQDWLASTLEVEPRSGLERK
ncbi:MAG: helix-turn-helix domain-containing protein [Nostocaceae cyanobacterium]|nr:helix-turn-helix domain-containing protein [Nostocaceae cyanobacterium]